MEAERTEDFVNVGIRIRPHLKTDSTNVTASLEVISKNPGVLYVIDKTQKYAFDYVFPEITRQEQVYEDMVKPLVDNVFDGYNSTVFAYGQTGTGKTFTMGSNPEKMFDENSGIITRALRQIFTKEEEVIVHISFLEIYNERVFDLLKNIKVPLVVKGFKVAGLEKRRVYSWNDAQSLLYEGGKNRHTGETKQNSNSSRSHAIFIIYCKMNHGSFETEAKFNLVDLAGSESIKKTGNEGHQMSEGISINKGLLSIGQVINALSYDRQFIPYRESTITTILQDSLNRKNFVTLIACISPSIEDAHETVQTLDFAQRAKKVKNRPELNNVPSIYSKSTVKKYKPTPLIQQIPSVRTKLFTKTRRCNTSLSNRKRLPLHSTQIEENARYHPYDFSMGNTSTTSSIHDPNRYLLEKEYLLNMFETAKQNIIQKIRESAMHKTLRYPDAQSKDDDAKIIIEKEFTALRNKTLAFQAENLESDENSLMDYQNIDIENKENEIVNIVSSLDDKISSPIVEDVKTDLEESPLLFKMPITPPKKGGKASILKTSSPVLSRKPRRSVRLMAKKCSSCNTSPVEAKAQSNQTKKASKKEVEVLKTRKSLRISMKVSSNELSHTLKVLNILNNGSLADLQNLSTIGPKTALMLHNYRELRGKFKTIADLRSFPWRGKSYSKFIETNFLVET